MFNALVLGLALLTSPPEWTTVYAPGESGYKAFRIPAIVQSNEGTLLAFAEGRVGGLSDTGDIDLVLKRSRDGGATWGPLQVVVNDAGFTCGNPVPIVLRGEARVVLLLTKNPADAKEHAIHRGRAPARTVWVTHSDDDGATWAVPRDISDSASKPGWRWYATGPCHGIQLQSGRLLVPANHSTSEKHEDWHSHVIYSDDQGATWSIGGIQCGYSNESCVAEVGGKRIYQNMRYYRDTHRRAVTWSEDEGATWLPCREDPVLIEPVCQASCLSMPPASDRVLFANPASEKRERLTVRLSEDGGRSWVRHRLLWEGPAAYSDLVPLDGGTAGCLAEIGEKNPYERIGFARFAANLPTPQTVTE